MYLGVSGLVCRLDVQNNFTDIIGYHYCYSQC